MARNVARGKKSAAAKAKDNAPVAVAEEEDDELEEEEQTEGGQTDDEEEDDEEEEEVTEVPDFHDEDGVIVPLKKRDFPKTLKGYYAFCDYNIEKWKVKKSKRKSANDPKAKAKAKLDRYRKMIEKIEAELDEDDADEE